jgi:hypothetical protein
MVTQVVKNFCLKRLVILFQAMKSVWTLFSVHVCTASFCFFPVLADLTLQVYLCLMMIWSSKFCFIFCLQWRIIMLHEALPFMEEILRSLWQVQTPLATGSLQSLHHMYCTVHINSLQYMQYIHFSSQKIYSIKYGFENSITKMSYGFWPIQYLSNIRLSYCTKYV